METEEVTTIQKENPAVVKTVKKVVTPPVQMEHPQRVFEKKKVIFRSYQIIWYILGFVEVLLGFRITLKALGANPFSGFVSLIYTLSDPLSIPFSGILKSSVSGSSVVEWSTIFAAIVYLLLAWGLVNLLQFIKPVTPQEVEQTVDNP